MASLYRDSKSLFWFLRYKAIDGRWRSKSLRPLRHGVREDTAKAREKAAEHSLEELSRAPQREQWASWVPQYLTSRYKNLKSLERMKQCWSRLSEYLLEKQLLAPQDLNYSNCRAYLPWRVQTGSHNTAVLELRLLGAVCQEALRRGIIRTNPAYKLGYGIIKGKEKPEFTDDNIRTIRTALKTKPAWMSYAFEIALHTGCRLRETALFKDDVDIAGGRLHFRVTKGSKPFTVPLNPAVKGMMEKLFVSDPHRHSLHIFDLPANAATYFYDFFDKLGIPGACFHCTRVTVATRLARSGYPLSKALRLLNHSSELIHRTYQRLQPQDVFDGYAELKIPPHDDSK